MHHHEIHHPTSPLLLAGTPLPRWDLMCCDNPPSHGDPHPTKRLSGTWSSWAWDDAFFQGTHCHVQLLLVPQECTRAPGGRAPVCCFNKYGGDGSSLGELSFKDLDGLGGRDSRKDPSRGAQPHPELLSITGISCPKSG